MMESLFEQTGGTYRTENDYRVPNLTVPDEPEHYIGIWGQRRLAYLKQHRRVLYINLLTSGSLSEHLSEIDATAIERRETIVRQMAALQGVTEELKVENQLLWVGRMNNICTCAEKIVQIELIFE